MPNIPINLNDLVIVLKDASEYVLGAPFNSFGFNFQLSISSIILLVVGKILNLILGGSSRNFIITFLGLLLPVLLGFIAFGVAKIYGAQFFPDTIVLFRVCLITAGSVAFIILMILSPFFLGSGCIKTIIIGLISYAATYFATDYIYEWVNNKKKDPKEKTSINSIDFS